MILDILTGFQPRFLYFDLEDYAGTYYTFSDDAAYNDNNEYYQLVQCCNDEPCNIGGQPTIFSFNGTANIVHPDDLLQKVITSITDESGNIVCGCFKLEEGCLVEGVNVIPFTEYFAQVTTVETCEECLPEQVIMDEGLVVTKKIIYAEPDYNKLDPEKVETIMCTFASVIFKEIQTLKFGIKFCCPSDFTSAKIDMEVLKLDLITDNSICCP
jgi:hypothetical protein